LRSAPTPPPTRPPTPAPPTASPTITPAALRWWVSYPTTSSGSRVVWARAGTAIPSAKAHASRSLFIRNPPFRKAADAAQAQARLGRADGGLLPRRVRGASGCPRFFFPALQLEKTSLLALRARRRRDGRWAVRLGQRPAPGTAHRRLGPPRL